MSTVVRIYCEAPIHAEILLEETEGKGLLNMLGRTYEGFLARGEGAQVIKALSKLGKDDNEGTILCAPKLANYLLRTVTERLAHFAYKMNSTNDKVENQRWGKNGLKLTDDMLDASLGHEEVYRLSKLLTVLTLASQHYSDVFFVREELVDKEVPEEVLREYTDADNTGEDADEEDEDDDLFDEDESPVSNQPITKQRRDLMEARQFGRTLVQRALVQSENMFGRTIDLNELMDEDEIERWENTPDKAMLVHTVKEIVQMFVKPKEAVSLLVNLTEEEREEIKSPFAYNLFKIEGPQDVWPQQEKRVDHTETELDEITSKVFQRATGHSVDGFPPILKPEGIRRWVVAVETFMTHSEREKIPPMETVMESSLAEMFAHHYEAKDSEKTGLYNVQVASETECPPDTNSLYLVVTDLQTRADS